MILENNLFRRSNSNFSFHEIMKIVRKLYWKKTWLTYESNVWNKSMVSVFTCVWKLYVKKIKFMLSFTLSVYYRSPAATLSISSRYIFRSKFRTVSNKPLFSGGNLPIESALNFECAWYINNRTSSKLQFDSVWDSDRNRTDRLTVTVTQKL